MTAEEYEAKLDDLMGEILFRMNLLSDGKTSISPDRRGGAPGKAGDNILRLTSSSWAWTLRGYQRSYEKALNISDKRRLIAEALSTYLRAKRAKRVTIFSEKRRFKEFREEVARDLRPAWVVADAYGLSRPLVFKYRREFGVNGRAEAA